MNLLDKLEKRFGRFAVPNLTLYLIAGQTIFYVMFLTGRVSRTMTLLAGDLLHQGEWWRLVTFPFDPPLTNLLKAAQKRGCKTLDGLGMLVNQGVIGIKYWTGVDVDAGVMQQALLDLGL